MRSVVRAVRRMARTHVDEGEKFAAAASIAGEGTPFEVQKTHILLGFSGWHGAC
jgi:hypothetical protein